VKTVEPKKNVKITTYRIKSLYTDTLSPEPDEFRSRNGDILNIVEGVTMHIQLSRFRLWRRLQARFPKAPYMSDRDVQAIANVLSERQPSRVLEWGAGGSTVYWPRQFPFIRQWISVEHDRLYAYTIRLRAPANVKMRILKPPAYWLSIQGQYDLILIDGRWRVECAAVAHDLLAPGGCVLLHDAYRPRYAAIEAMFGSRQALTQGCSAGSGVVLFEEARVD